MDDTRKIIGEGVHSRIAACTIISKNYLPYARILVDSFLQYHAGIPFFVLLVDTMDGYFEPGLERFALVRMEDLNIPELDRFCFQYTAIELNTAAKPYLLSYLFANYGFDKLVYFDPDILILQNLSALFALLDKYSIILTPHLTAPLPRDGCAPDEITILRAGTYNLGFIALANTPTTRNFLPWWQDRLYKGCQMDPDRGMHVDQKWVDLIPGFFKDVHILAEPGYNVAYWNLPTRTIQVMHGTVSVNGQPGYFFHFSGINPDIPQSISKHSNRFDLNNVGPAAALYKNYKGQLISYGYHETKNWPYAYGSFDNGLKIPDIARRLYIHLGDDVREFGNPFETALPNSFFNWLNAEADNQRDPSRAITRLWHGIYDLRPDLQRAHPDLFGVHRDAFLQWTAKSGIYEYDIPDRFALHALKRSVLPENEKKRKKSAAHGRFGVNLAGALASEKGVGEAARSAIRILDTARIPYVLNDFQDLGSANDAMSFGNIRRDNPYRVNLGVMGVDAIPVFAEQKGASYFDGRYNIGHWAWELVDFPQEWFRNFQIFDEIWVASSFIQRALSKLAPVPVNTVPYTVTGEMPNDARHRWHLGLPKDTFVFLFMFDFHSFVERKNPLGLIKAFKNAFTPRDDVLLLLKCAHSKDEPAALEAVQESSRNANIRITDCVLTREQIKTLIYLSDCYVSLHRAEGFGFTLAEAMSLERPVIATGYSGNMGFMTARNSFPVKYKLIPIAQDHGPYKRGFVWADPDLDHAAELMRFAYENRDLAREVGRRARQDVLGTLHPEVVGPPVKERLLKVARL